MFTIYVVFTLIRYCKKSRDDLKYVEGCGEFPGGPVVETLLFHHRVYRFDPGLRN